MNSVVFDKYEGLGNDFIVVESTREDALSSSAVRELCDRRRGVGADGVLLMLPPESAKATARMRVLNADGSIPEMCGNGLRCAVLHVARRVSTPGGEMTFETDAGLRGATFERRHASGNEALVTIDMGVARVDDDVRIDIEGEPWTFTRANVGNPHAVSIRTASSLEVATVGALVSMHSAFPEGANVGFASFGSAGVDLVVWERGVGLTLACGTGACAAVAVGVAKGLVGAERDVAVNLPGGKLSVSIGKDGRATMRGPARHTFHGEWRP